MDVRETAKGVIRDIDNLVIFVAGNSCMLNLVGGERNEGEEPLDAFLREAGEEIAVEERDLMDLQEVSALDGVTVSTEGAQHHTFATIFSARLPYSYTELHIPQDSEITAIAGIPDYASLQHPDVLEFSQRIVRRAMDLGL